MTRVEIALGMSVKLGVDTSVDTARESACATKMRHKRKTS
jgi:hypothetical protein